MTGVQTCALPISFCPVCAVEQPIPRVSDITPRGRFKPGKLEPANSLFVAWGNTRMTRNLVEGTICGTASSSVELGAPVKYRTETSISDGSPVWTRFELYWPKTAFTRTHNGPCSSISYLSDDGGCPGWVLRRDASRTRRLQDVASRVMIGLVRISTLLRVTIRL